jgi:glycogen debranching enzyme
MIVHTQYKAHLEVLRMQIGKGAKPDPALSLYVQKIADITGIEIKTLEDIEVFKEEIIRSKDKFDEMFRKPDTEPQKGVSIVELWWRICATAELSPDINNTTLYELAELKAQAEEKVRAINELNKK